MMYPKVYKACGIDFRLGGNQKNMTTKGNEKVAIVTGAASGIGKSIAEVLAKSGDKVVIVDFVEKGEEVAKSIGGYFVRTDLTIPSDCRKAVEKTIGRYGTVDILINNAGIQHTDNIPDFPEESWDRMMAVMLDAPFRLTKHVWNTMASKKWGRIINTASLLGLRGQATKCAYVAAKHGLIGLTKVAAIEGGPLGITANAICPAPVQTDMVDTQLDKLAQVYNISRDRVIPDVFLERAVVKRLIDPMEIAAVVRFLCSEEAAAINGLAVSVDLGWTANY
jgi:3-hydroxybutyrate dehydrogenase